MLRLQQRLDTKYEQADDQTLVDIITHSKKALGEKVIILGHHYQRDEIIQFADQTGDSLALSRYAANQDKAAYVVFCGVEFMAEAADILTSDDQKVILPDLGAGCSMADMADIDSVELAWKELSQMTDMDAVIPITYINSSAAIKDFVGRHKGAVCTSSNASNIIRWALGLDPKSDLRGSELVREAKKRGRKVFFFPDQHLAINTAWKMGFPIEDNVLYDPYLDFGGVTKEALSDAQFILWKGHCSVHQRFTTAQIQSFRHRHENAIVMAHPECSNDVIRESDIVGSTDAIIKAVAAAPPESHIGIATEVHLVNRLAKTYTDRYIECLDPILCPCATMNRIDLPHLAWIMESLTHDVVHNQIIVDEIIKEGAKIALDKMLQIV